MVFIRFPPEALTATMIFPHSIDGIDAGQKAHMTKKQQRRPISRVNEPPAQNVAAIIFYSKPAEEPAAIDTSRLVRAHSPTLGDASAKVHIVEFFDPACGTCRDFYPFVRSEERRVGKE